MRRRSRNFEIFTISFLDVIACGFGAIVLLVLISKTSVIGGSVDTERISELFKTLAQSEAQRANLQSQSEQLAALLGEQSANEAKLQAEIAKARQTLSGLQSENKLINQNIASLDQQLVALNKKKAALQKKATPPSATISVATNTPEEIYAGGIPVDADYIIFILDTSGSMKGGLLSMTRGVWSEVVAQMRDILKEHPQVKGFQIMNDNGIHMFRNYRGQWLIDSPSLRNRVLSSLRAWGGTSNSSPVEGLEAALRLYVQPSSKKISIYVLGDDYSGASYDPLLKNIARLNSNRVTRKSIARIHAIGFYNTNANDKRDGFYRFGALMREMGRQNQGTFIGLRGNFNPISSGECPFR